MSETEDLLTEVVHIITTMRRAEVYQDPSWEILASLIELGRNLNVEEKRDTDS